MASVIRGSDNFDSLIHQGLGVNQTWQDVTASRAIGVTYTNSTGKPIILSIYGTGSNIASGYAVMVDGLLQHGSPPPVAGGYCAISGVIVPHGKTYTVNPMSGTVTILKWNELR